MTEVVGREQRQWRNRRRELARQITLIESTKFEDRQRAMELLGALPPPPPSIRIGVGGTPGVGKSTFIEALGLNILARGRHAVAVLAVDPSSPLRGGSVLGDKLRMQRLAQADNAFIRPSPGGGGGGGGVARRTQECVLLCESAGYHVIIVETIGSGQAEYRVSDMVDLFVLLLQPAAGDEVQGIKRGAVELADILVVNKADGELRDLAVMAQTQYRNALGLNIADPERGKTPVLLTSALNDEGIDEVARNIEDMHRKMLDDGRLESKRARQNMTWLNELLGEMMRREMDSAADLKRERRELESQLRDGAITPHLAARRLAESLFAASRRTR